MAVSLPVLTVAGIGNYAAATGAVTLPALTVEGHGGPPNYLPMLTVAGVGYTGLVGKGAVILPALEVSGADQPVIQLPAFTVAGVGQTGDITGSGEIEIPVLEVDGAGYENRIGTAAITLPVLRILGAATTPLSAVDTTTGAAGSDTGLELSAGEAFVLNLRNNALTTYNTYGFNSFATFKGVNLGANATGIFIVASGSIDDTADIVATVRFGITDLDDPHLKRAPRVYAGYRTDGEAVVRVRANEGGWRTYPLRGRSITGLHTDRVPIGKGLKGRYWQIEIENVEGASLELDGVELMPTLIARRVA